MTQGHAWDVYHRWLEDGRIAFMPEPVSAAFEQVFNAASLRPRPATKACADAYLAAFARVAGLNLVTFDRSFPRLAGLELELLQVCV